MSIIDLIFRKREISKNTSSILDGNMYALCTMYGLPMDFVKLVCNQERDKKKQVYMLKGASMLFRHKELLGDSIPINDTLSIEVAEFLIKKGVSIQYTFDKGMVLLKTRKQ